MAFQKSYGAVLCTDVSHIANDESTAPERILGMRLRAAAQPAWQAGRRQRGIRAGP